MKKIECFKIRIHEANGNIFNCIEDTKEIHYIDCDRSLFCIDPNVINADPFLFVHNEKLYLFYESKILGIPAVINMIFTDDLEHWSKPVTVLKEEFHLSFPYVFEENNTVYMIPETGQDHSVRLYAATNDELTQFNLVNKLIERKKAKEKPLIDYCDSSVYKNEDKYYLFTSECSKNLYALRLFYSDYLNGPYFEHIMSPVVRSNKTGRCGGNIFKYENNLFRIAQDCEQGYGDNIHILKINELSTEKYDEEIIKENVFPRKKFYAKGGHQLNITKFGDKYLVATDAKEYHYFFFSRIYRRLKKQI